MAGGKVKNLLAAMTKEYGKEVGTLGVRDDEPTRLPTGMFTFDLITGGGIPEGRITLIYGHESAMKTTLTLKAIAAAQRKYPDRTAAFVDIEGHLDRKWAKKMGVDVDKLAHIIPENAEQAVDIIEALLSAEDISIVVADSIAALQTQAELAKSTEELTPGKSGFVVNKFYRKATHALNAARVEGGHMPTLLVINQVRYKIGAGPGQDPETMPGGPAFKFAASLSIRLNGSDVMEAKVHKTLPAFKRISVIIKKHKVPVLAKKGEMMVALQPNAEHNLEVGELYAWGTVRSYLESLNLLVKSEQKGGGWDFTHPGTGELTWFKTRDELKQQIRDDVTYADDLYADLIRRLVNEGDVIEAE